MTDRDDHIASMTESWARLTGSTVEAALAANAAAVDALAPPVATDGRGDDDDDDDAPDDAGTGTGAGAADDGATPERRPPEADSVLYETADWTVERSVSDDLAVGDTVSFAKPITDEDVRRFAVVTGDTNRLHLDEEYAAESRFGGRIAHGGLVAALVSAALARLPGVTIYLSQESRFLGPVRVGDEARAAVEVVEDVGDDRYRLETVVESGGETVVDGEAVVLVEDEPSA